jgi:tetratricopeptide (TPR) repeat protein
MQKHYRTLRDESQRLLWEKKVAEYRKLQVKPTVSEEQRKFIVQANLFNQQKNFVKAIELYSNAIELDQTAYPAAYSNLALLLAQINNFSAAIANMKKYLLLEPEATDARSAQDKIYEWEAMIPK